LPDKIYQNEHLVRSRAKLSVPLAIEATQVSPSTTLAAITPAALRLSGKGDEGDAILRMTTDCKIAPIGKYLPHLNFFLQGSVAGQLFT
jgi:hypothetical protein